MGLFDFFFLLKPKELQLKEAVASGDYKKVVQLISKGANVNETFTLNWTLLMIAVENNFLDIAKLLIEKGADVNAKAYWGQTALTIAKEKGFKLMILLLKEYGAKGEGIRIRVSGDGVVLVDI